MADSASSLRIPEAKVSLLRARPAALLDLNRGVEKESLRVGTDGILSQLPHPQTLGSPLTHPAITTDFSEAQLELITGVHESADACLDELTSVHRFVYTGIDDELLWPSSMPCIVGDDADIPIGRYGRSNIGRAKTVYRRGLGLRYGRLMQTISGIHYNFSLSDAAWDALGVTTQGARTDAYFGLIRNFRRWSWLLIYLFGASPAVCRSFTRHLQHNLQPFDEGSQYLPFATSLRMGPLGYQSSAQAGLHISYNSLDQYAASMVEALTQEYPAYARYGVLKNGEYQQLSTSVLQIENEFYGTIRPKRRTEPGERPVTALRNRGVEYVEVRCLDLNPFLAVGIDREQMLFIDTFLLACLLVDSAPDSQRQSERLVANQIDVVERGREPGLTLRDGPNQTRVMTEWAHALLSVCDDIAEIMDDASGQREYRSAVANQRDKINDAALTPSARVLADMQSQAIPFFRFSMNQAIAHRDSLRAPPLSAAALRAEQRLVEESLLRQQAIEDAETLSFADFLDDYLTVPAA